MRPSAKEAKSRVLFTIFSDSRRYFSIKANNCILINLVYNRHSMLITYSCRLHFNEWHSNYILPPIGVHFSTTDLSELVKHRLEVQHEVLFPESHILDIRTIDQSGKVVSTESMRLIDVVTDPEERMVEHHSEPSKGRRL